MTRHQFDTWIPTGSQLRDLACDIARFDATRGYCFLTNPADKVHNFLANAEIGGAWHQPMDYLPQTLARWKCNYRSTLPLTPVEEQGFNQGASTRRGLALLFDPLVDSFLAAHLRAGPIAPGGTVIVLSDFYPLAKAIPKGIYSGDWGLGESQKYLGGDVPGDDLTVTYLFNALFGKDKWPNNSNHIPEVVREKQLLLWNFLPMFRGGSLSAQGEDGLPISGHWRGQCWQFMCDFLAAVGARKVVLACSKEMLQLPKFGNHNRSYPIPRPPSCLKGSLQPPLSPSAGFCPPLLLNNFPPLPSCVEQLYRIYHPRSWTGPGCADGETLQQILQV